MNIRIRHVEGSDAEAIAKIYTSPRVLWGTLQVPFRSMESRRKRVTELPPGEYMMVAEVDGEVVGNVGLHVSQVARRAHSAGVYMGVRDDWQGKGIGTALMEAVVDLADQWLNLKRLELEVYTDNEPALRLYKKFGFEIEGTLRQFAFREGAFVDAYMMSRIKP